MTDPEINLGMPSISMGAATAPFVPLQPPPAYNASANAPQYHLATTADMSDEQLSTLGLQGFPRGLALQLGQSKLAYPLRFWVIDNSGSMRTNDGHMLRGSQDRIQVVSCNRWKELQGAVDYHAQLAGLLQVTTVFRMLNDPGVLAGPQEFTVGDVSAPTSMQEQVNVATSVIQKSEPTGVTPLTEHLLEIRRRIEVVEPTLRNQGQKAVIVLATDGLPSDNRGQATEAVKQEFIQALRSLQPLPVWVVIRLCTDSDDVVEYYNNLDSVLELPLEVIDDLLGEAEEIHSANKWLNYALPLHRCREMGYQHRVFDLLDERLLNKDELLTFLELLFGAEDFRNIPDIHADWKGFSAALAKIVKNNGKQFNPHSKRMEHWIDMKQLNKSYGGGFRLFGW